MKHIHFVIYRLKKGIIIISCSYLILFFNSFSIICISSVIKFVKPSDDVKIQGETITFTKDWKFRTVFINKMINSGIMRMFFFIIFVFMYSILLAKCYAFAQIFGVFLI
jgi:hypothetical protein